MIKTYKLFKIVPMVIIFAVYITFLLPWMLSSNNDWIVVSGFISILFVFGFLILFLVFLINIRRFDK